MTVLCQWCGALNPDDRERCLRCNSTLLVVSGTNGDFSEETLEEEEASPEHEKLAFDEHMLERLSATEEGLKRMNAALARAEERVADLERGIALLDSGVQALIELLDRRKVVRETEVMAAWERAATSEMAREELLERLRQRREAIVFRARAAGGSAAAACARALQSAELALLAGQPLRAAETLAEALRRYPRNPELAELLGELAFERNDLGAAEQYFRQVLRWNEENVEAQIYLGTILADAGREQEAARHLDRAAALAPENFLPHFSLGAFHASGGRAAEARRHLKASLEREEIPQAWFLLGMVELDSGHVAPAIAAFERAVEMDGEFEDAIYYLGLAFLERGWHRKALECFRRVQEMDPQRLQYQEAVRLIEAGGAGSAELPPEAEVLMREASRASEAGEIERALQQLQHASRIADHPSLLASLALLAAAAGKPRQALAAAHRLLRSGTAGAPVLAAWTALLETLRAARRYSAVSKWGGRLFEEGAGALERGVAAYELALAELEREGNVNRALEYAHSSLELIPRELRAYPLAALGRIHLARAEYSDAVDYLEQAVAISSSPALLTQLGLALLEAGDGGRAREVLQRARHGAVRDLKTDVLTHLARVGWLAGRGRRKG
ncbi:MAG TPA: tetratricopeptide repeat protein [Thermoanaerobaculaceae bacterium]|nr:tetratricopeptide repeat protein [Thermoanaerobaculaceae bacterium]